MDENKKGMPLLAECQYCKQKFELSDKVNYKVEFDIGGKSIFLTYYDCPSCGRRHFVQIDDEKSLQDLEIIRREFIKLSIMKKKGKEIPRKQSERFKKSRKNLSEYRMNLMKCFTGKIIVDENGIEYPLRFNIWS